MIEKRSLATTLALALTIALTTLASGGRSAPASAALEKRVIDVGGVSRTYYLYVPPRRAAGPTPLVLAFHGGGGTAEGMDRGAKGKITAAAAKRGWLVAFPEGVAKGWNDGRPLTAPRDAPRDGVDDVAFAKALIAELVAEDGVDGKRVYATGASNGGFMTLRLAVDAADLVAAAGVVIATHAEVIAGAAPARPVPILFMDGTEDPIVPWGGGSVVIFGRSRGEVMSVDATIAWWRERDRCPDAPPAVEAIPNRALLDGTRTTARTWGPCAEGSEVVLYEVAGGGHTMPGGTQYLPKALVGRVSRDFDGPERIFAFFERHALP